MKDWPEVSVIIPTCNSARFIRAALESVLAQRYLDFEVIVVDDASRDDTPRIVEEYGPRVRLLRRENNSGSADIPRYEAVARSGGRWCAFLDADDLWEPEKLERQVEFMRAHPEVQLSHTYARIIDEEGRPDGIRHEGVIPPTGMIARDLLRHCFICTSSVMVQREAWLRAQRPETLGGYGTEWDFFLSIARQSPVGFIPEPLTRYRRHSGSVSRGDWRRRPRDLGAKRRIYRKGLWRGVIPRREMWAIIREAAWENAEYYRGQGAWRRGMYFGLVGLAYGPWDCRLWGSLFKSLLGPLRGRSAKEDR